MGFMSGECDGLNSTLPTEGLSQEICDAGALSSISMKFAEWPSCS